MKARMFCALVCAIALCAVALPSDESVASPESGWSLPVPLEFSSFNAGSLDMAVESSGDAFATWAQHDGTSYNMMVNRYVLGQGWLYPESIDLSADGVGYPQISADGSGNAMAIWTQPSDELRASRYVAGSGWEIPVIISSASASVWFTDVAMDPYGNAIAVWVQDDGIDEDSLWANVYTTDEGWGTPLTIESESYQTRYPKIAMDATGNATVVWYDLETSYNHIWGNTYSPDSGWAGAQLVEENATASSMYPQVAMDGEGNAMVVWHEYAGARTDAWSNMYIAGEGWGTEELIEENDGGYAYEPVVGFDGAGNAVAAWAHTDGPYANATANMYIAGVGWGQPETIAADELGYDFDLRIAVNADGVACASWIHRIGTLYDTYANRYVPGIGWDSAVLLEHSLGACGYHTSVGIDGTGNSFVAWTQRDVGDTSSIFASRYTVPDTVPPALTVTSPLPGTETYLPSVSVMGETEPGVELFVNGMLTAVDSTTGGFATTVALVEGSNDIVVTAVDSWDNTAAVTVTVVYTDAYSDQIADLQEQIEELLTLLEELTGGDADPETNLTALSEELASLRELLNSTADQLEEISDRLDAIDDSDVAGSGASDAPSMATLMGVVAVAALLLLAVMIALYLNLRKMVHEGKAPRDDSEEPPPPQ